MRRCKCGQYPDVCARYGHAGGDSPLKPIVRPRPRAVDSHVWCDVHCDIHPRERDYYDEGVDDCNPDNWRTVYVASTDPLEFA